MLQPHVSVIWDFLWYFCFSVDGGGGIWTNLSPASHYLTAKLMDLEFVLNILTCHTGANGFLNVKSCFKIQDKAHKNGQTNIRWTLHYYLAELLLPGEYWILWRKISTRSWASYMDDWLRQLICDQPTLGTNFPESFLKYNRTLGLG